MASGEDAGSAGIENLAPCVKPFVGPFYKYVRSHWLRHVLKITRSIVLPVDLPWRSVGREPLRLIVPVDIRNIGIDCGNRIDNADRVSVLQSDPRC